MKQLGRFSKNDMRKLFRDKKVIFLGDSIIRDIYKDSVWLYQKGRLVPHAKLVDGDDKAGTVQRSLTHGETLRDGTGQLTADLKKGRNYKEEREFRGKKDHPTLFRFYFLTKCWSDHLEKFLLRVKEEDGEPDLVMILSCLWDTNRWGRDGIDQYKSNCDRFLSFIRSTFPTLTQLIWLTSPPVAVEVWGGLFVPEIDFTKQSTRFNVMEANTMVGHTTAAHGFKVVDLHYRLQCQLHQRREDGIHWSARANRLMLNIILTHLSISWKTPVPVDSSTDEDSEEEASFEESEESEEDQMVLD